jgi:hypothetical protein
MVDTLVFLKNDYSEKEIHDITDKINAYIRFFGGDYARLLKTTDNTIFYEEIEDFKVPREILMEHLSPEELSLYDEFVRYDEHLDANMSMEEYKKFEEYAESEKYDDVIGEVYAIKRMYCKKNGGYKTTRFEPNKYVILARLNAGTWKDLDILLQLMNIEATAMVHWWSEEFDEEDEPFEKVNYEPINIPTARYLFWLDNSISDEEYEASVNKLKENLKSYHYGLYIWDDDFRAFQAKKGFYAKRVIPKEYEKYDEFKFSCLIREIEKAKETENTNEEDFANSVDVVMQELRQYRQEHKMYERFRVAKGQKVIPLLLIMNDFDEIIGLFDKCGLRIHTVTMQDEETACFENLVGVNNSNENF